MRYLYLLECLICTLVLLIKFSNGQAFQLAQSDECGVTEENDQDPRTKVPWVAGIFSRTSSTKEFKFLITGTVLSPKIVLTVFSGVYGEPRTPGGKYFIPPPLNHLIATGLNSNSLTNVDGFTQISEVTQIIPFSQQEEGNKQYHLYLFHLKKALSFNSSYVRPACLPVYLKTLPGSNYAPNIEVRQGGFGSPVVSDGTSKLHIVNISLGTSDYCSNLFKEYYKDAKIGHPNCGTSRATEVPVCAIHGSAATLQVYNNKWFIVGTTSLIPSIKGATSWCNTQTIYFYNNIYPELLDWILANIKCSESNKFACKNGNCININQVCDQKAECADGSDEDSIYCRGIRPCIFGNKTHECGVYGSCINPSQVCDGKPDCEDKSDEREIVCIEKKISSAKNGQLAEVTHQSLKEIGPPRIVQRECLPIQISEGVQTVCSDSASGSKIDCNKAKINSVARLSCQKYYKSTYRLPATEMKCQKDGSWKPYRPFGCEPDCGILTSELTAFILSGQVATRRDSFPWHATMFLRKNDDYVFICGGSLIEKGIVLTAGHCITDSGGALVAKNNFRIVLGAISSNYSENLKDPYAQFFNAKNLWIPATYDRRTLQSDIALIELNKPALFTDSVRPVCYLSSAALGLPETNELGKVPGFGFINDTTISETLMFASLPVVGATECIKSLKRVPPLSTFCAGFKNGTSVCQGDSGGGMVFPQRSGNLERYILKGIVSHGEVKAGRLCDPFNYAVFTHVDAYADWILQKLESIRI